MEKENFYSILDEMCTYNFQTYFENTEWYKESLASQVESEMPSESVNQNTLRENIITHMDDLHKRKLKLFEKKFKSYQELESKEPHLILVANHPEERYIYFPWINWDKYDPLINEKDLPTLYKELKNKKFCEIFYQPISTKFIDNLEIFIKQKINEDDTEENKIEQEKPKEQEKPHKDEEKTKMKNDMNKPLWIIALDIYYILNIYQGNYIRMSNFHK